MASKPINQDRETDAQNNKSYNFKETNNHFRNETMKRDYREIKQSFYVYTIVVVYIDFILTFLCLFRTEEYISSIYRLLFVTS